MLALGPTVKRNSFLVSAIAADTRQVANTKATTVVRCMLSINAPGIGLTRIPLWLLNMIQRHLVQHSLLFVGVHQMFPGIFIRGIFPGIGTGIADIGIH